MRSPAAIVLSSAFVLAVCASPAEAERYVLPGTSDYSFAPEVGYDARNDRLQLWYNDGDVEPGPATLYMESASGDPGDWSDPVRIDIPGAPYGTWGTTVVDTEEPGPQRYLMAYWLQDCEGCTQEDGVHVAASPDGVTAWQPIDPDPATEYIEPLFKPADDIVDLWRDPGTGRYGIFVKNTDKGMRYTKVRRGPSVTEFGEPKWAFFPDGADANPDNLQFYGAACCVERDGTLYALLRVLREDVYDDGDPETPIRGIGYTVVARSRDGTNWFRSREPFLKGCAGTEDQAMAWAYGMAAVGDELVISYSAYDTGHKLGKRKPMIARVPLKSLQSEEPVPCENGGEAAEAAGEP